MTVHAYTKNDRRYWTVGPDKSHRDPSINEFNCYVECEFANHVAPFKHRMIVSGELLTTHGDVVNDSTNIYLDLTPVHNYTPSNRMQKVVPPQTVLHYLHGLVKKADVNDY